MDKNSPKVTIIVPVYKVEKYIGECIKSIINQDYKHLEIIIVDDGSPDNSGKIADYYADRDERVRVIHQDNAGVSAARNAGLKIATGDFLMFVDGDDIVSQDYASYLLDIALKTKSDIAVSVEQFDVYNDRQVAKDIIEVYSTERAVCAVYSNEINVAVWNKIYRKNFIDTIRQKFLTEYWFGEGFTFNIAAFQKANHIGVCRRKVYHWRHNPESATHLFNIKNWESIFRVLEYQRSNFIMEDAGIRRAWRYHYWLCHFNTYREIIRAGEKEKYSEYKKQKKRFVRSHIFDAFYPFSAKRIIFAIAAFFSPYILARTMIKRETIAVGGHDE